MKLKMPRPWIESSADELRHVENTFILDVTHSLAQAIDAKAQTRRALAESVSMAPQQLSEALANDSNITLRTVARIAYAADLYPRLEFVPIAEMDAPRLEGFLAARCPAATSVSAKSMLTWDFGVRAATVLIDTRHATAPRKMYLGRLGAANPLAFINGDVLTAWKAEAPAVQYETVAELVGANDALEELKAS